MAELRLPADLPSETDIITAPEPHRPDATVPTGRAARLARHAASVVGFGCDVVVGLAVLTEVVVLFGSAAARSLFDHPLLWDDDVGILSLSVITFVGTASAYGRNAHPIMHVIVDRVPVRLRRILLCFDDIVVGFIAVALATYAAQQLAARAHSYSPILHLAQSWYLLPVVVGMGLVAALALLRVLAQQLRVIAVAAAGAVVLGAVLWAVSYYYNGYADFGAAVLAVVFVLLLCAGVPIAFVLCASGLAFVYLGGDVGGSGGAIATSLQGGVTSDVLLAIPLFVLTGLLLSAGRLSDYLVRFVNALVGRVPNGLLHVVVVCLYIFSGLSGSKIADVAAVGSAVSDRSKQEGYQSEDLAAVLAASAVMGETVPPSIALIVLASISTLSVTALFLAGLIPAAVLGLFIIGWIAIRSRRHGGVRAASQSGREKARSGLLALPVLAVVVLVFAGVATGVMTPVESSSTAAVLSIVLVAVYRRSKAPVAYAESLRRSSQLVGMVMFLIASASAFSFEFISSGLAQHFISLFSAVDSTWYLLLVTIVIVPLLGAILEGLPALLVFGPPLVELADKLGVPPIQYAIVFLVALGLGSFLPPIGVGFFTACGVAGADYHGAARRMRSYVLALVIGLVLLAVVPSISTWLPTLAGHG